MSTSELPSPTTFSDENDTKMTVSGKLSMAASLFTHEKLASLVIVMPLCNI